MKKVKVIDKNSIKSIKYERELLSKLHHPFLVNMYYSFQDYEYLYLIMDLLKGGDLRYHISRHKKFTEEQEEEPKNQKVKGKDKKQKKDKQKKAQEEKDKEKKEKSNKKRRKRI